MPPDRSAVGLVAAALDVRNVGTVSRRLIVGIGLHADLDRYQLALESPAPPGTRLPAIVKTAEFREGSAQPGGELLNDPDNSLLGIAFEHLAAVQPLAVDEIDELSHQANVHGEIGDASDAISPLSAIVVGDGLVLLASGRERLLLEGLTWKTSEEHPRARMSELTDGELTNSGAAFSQRGKT